MSVGNVRTPNCKCKACGVEFWTEPSRIKLGRGKHCSHKCQFSKTPEQRFWEKVVKSDGCWLWKGNVNQFGYGRFRTTSKKLTVTHRISWELHNGPIPDGMMVLHRCDVPACVKPDHLFLGTQIDNVADMYSKGRECIRRGEEHHRALVSEIDVIAMRSVRDKVKMAYSKLGRLFGVSEETARNICLRETWKHLP